MSLELWVRLVRRVQALTPFALFLGLAMALGPVPPSARAIELPTTTLPTVTVPTLPSTLPALPIPTTTITLLPSTTTTAVTSTTSPATSTTRSVTSTSISSDRPLPVESTDTTVNSVRGGFVQPANTESTPSTTAVISEAPSTPAPTETVPSTTNRWWDEVFGFLRPVLPPALVEVLLSPFLVLEVVMRAMLDSGRTLLVPVAAMGGFAGWACWRWAPAIRHFHGVASGPTGSLDRWGPPFREIPMTQDRL